MSGSLILLLGALVLAGLALRGFVRASPHTIVRGLRAFTTAFGALASTGLLFAGRYGIAFVALCATGFAFWSLRQHSQGATAWDAGGGGGDEAAVGIETRYLNMRLDRASGEVSGEVRMGAFAGRGLASMGQGELLDLLAEVAREDGKSVPLLETYLDRRFADWRSEASAEAGSRAPAGDAPMDAGLARKILGVEEGATPDEVRQAHRRLMGLHPDRGGSDYLAGQINRARDILLGKR